MIRKLLILFVFAFIASYAFQMSAAGEKPETEVSKAERDSVALVTACEYIENIKVTSDGKIDVDIDPEILTYIFTEPEPVKHTANTKKVKREKVSNSGYRVQVFGEAGNQATLQSRCRARGSMVLARFPKYRGQLYMFSKSPNWYCRVGNFRTSGEAAKAAAELRRAFPQFSGEIRTVKSTIVPK